MLYFATPSGREVQAAIVNNPTALGWIDTPRQRNTRPAGVRWCADNGAYTKAFREGEWIEFLIRNAPHAATCAFATAPDVVGDAEATWERSAPWFDRIRELGYPAALVAQDGLEAPSWDRFDALFIGGTDAFKLGREARELVTEAKARGKWVHMGRVSSDKRWRYADAIGCDSVDGTYLRFGPRTNLPKLIGWTRWNEQEAIPL